MKTLLIILLMLPCFCLAQVRPDKPEPAKPRIDWNSGQISGSELSVIDSGLNITDQVTMYFPDSTIEIKGDTVKLFKMIYKKLLECQEKSRKDEIIIEGIFNTMKSKATILTKNPTITDMVVTYNGPTIDLIPVVNWDLPDTITYGQLLSVKASANIKGEFEMKPTEGRYPYFNDYNFINAGDYVISLTFTPANKKYKPFLKTKKLHVKKGNYYSSGTPVKNSILNAGNDVMSLTHMPPIKKHKSVIIFRIMEIFLIIALASMFVIDKIYQDKSVKYEL